MRAEDLAALLPTAASNASRPLAIVFLDSDGTLREFEDKPEEIQRLLAGLSGLSGLNVWIVSGRSSSFGHLSSEPLSVPNSYVYHSLLLE